MNKRQTVKVQLYSSPCGGIILGSIGDRLCLCDWNEKACVESNKRRISRILNADFTEETSDVINMAINELDEYFSGTRKEFDIPLQFAGTEFQRGVWRALLDIPYGETRSYMHIARAIGNPKGVRAVAQAVGDNAMSIIVPCHRVIGSDGSLTGFAGGLEAKRYLLALERRMPMHQICGRARMSSLQDI